MKVKTSPYERAVNALMRSDPKLSEELEAACRADMKRHLDEQAERDSLRAQRDAAVAEFEKLLKANGENAQYAIELRAQRDALMEALEGIRGYVVTLASSLKSRAEFREAFKLLNDLRAKEQR